MDVAAELIGAARVSLPAKERHSLAYRRAEPLRRTLGCGRIDSRKKILGQILSLYFDFSAEFHDLPRRHAEERYGALGIMLQEREQGLAPDRHADNTFPRNNRLTARIIADFRWVYARYLSLAASYQ